MAASGGFFLNHNLQSGNHFLSGLRGSYFFHSKLLGGHFLSSLCNNNFFSSLYGRYFFCSSLLEGDSFSSFSCSSFPPPHLAGAMGLAFFRPLSPKRQWDRRTSSVWVPTGPRPAHMFIFNCPPSQKRWISALLPLLQQATKVRNQCIAPSTPAMASPAMGQQTLRHPQGSPLVRDSATS